MSDTDQSQAGDAAQAFEHLTAEVSWLRHTVEELVDAIQLKEPPDYAPTLGGMAKELNDIARRLAEIEQHPALRMTPAQHQRAIVVAGEGLMHNAVQTLDSATAAAAAERRELVGLVGTVRGRRKQRKSLVWTGAVALLLGLLLSPVLARLLPFGLDGQVAAFILQADRWNAGAHLMQAQSPEAWRALMDADQLMAANSAPIGACRSAATKTKKEQHCSIIIPTP